MTRSLAIGVVIAVVLSTGILYAAESYFSALRFSDTEADFETYEVVSESQASPQSDALIITATSLPPIPEPLGENGRVRWSAYWDDMTLEEQLVYSTVPKATGSPRVGIQAGHWRLDEVPDELEGLRSTGGAAGGGTTEQETVLRIAEEVKTILEGEGVSVDLLPATVPVDYVAYAFVSIHADGSTSSEVSGFKLATSRRDFSGKADRLMEAIYKSYEDETGMRRDGSVTRRMSGYYAFNWRRYDHAVHPLVPSVIIETGFMTNADDRAIIVDDPLRPARGIARGILTFLDK